MIRVRYHIVLVLLAAMAASAAVDSRSSAAQNTSARPQGGQVDLLEIPQPDLTRSDPPVLEQIRTAQAALATALAQADASRVRRADAFGNLGQIYQAYSFGNAALACYSNASRLDPDSFRWSYYAGYEGQAYGDPETAERDYQHALTLKPNDGPTLLRLGSLELILDRSDAAKQYFTQAMNQQNPSAAALAGLGKVALAGRQFSAAVNYFTQALAREPQASSVHYQLAMAYRGLGDVAHAQEQMQARGDVEPVIQDPLLDEIDAREKGNFGLLERGSKALRENRFADGVAAYRQLVQLNPNDPLLYKYLGLALVRAAKPDEAMQQFERALQLDPRNASVHSHIGTLLIQAGREDEAIAQFQQAIQFDPQLVTAHFQLANLLMRRKQDADAEREYGIVVSLQPQNSFAYLMQAMAAVHAGSYNRARKLLEDASAAFPADPDIANALARVLAAAPDPAVRDQSRALRIVENLAAHHQGDQLEVGITLAMALAAAGHFQDAVGYQAAMIKQLEASREDGLARLLRPNLARYQQGKTCLVPWASDDPIFTPIPGDVQLAPEPKTTVPRS